MPVLPEIQNIFIIKYLHRHREVHVFLMIPAILALLRSVCLIWSPDPCCGLIVLQLNNDDQTLICRIHFGQDTL